MPHIEQQTLAVLLSVDSCRKRATSTVQIENEIRGHYQDSLALSASSGGLGDDRHLASHSCLISLINSLLYRRPFRGPGHRHDCQRLDCVLGFAIVYIERVQLPVVHYSMCLLWIGTDNAGDEPRPACESVLLWEVCRLRGKPARRDC